jgi:hypothetical protein
LELPNDINELKQTVVIAVNRHPAIILIESLHFQKHQLGKKVVSLVTKAIL